MSYIVDCIVCDQPLYSSNLVPTALLWGLNQVLEFPAAILSLLAQDYPVAWRVVKPVTQRVCWHIRLAVTISGIHQCIGRWPHVSSARVRFFTTYANPTQRGLNFTETFLISLQFYKNWKLMFINFAKIKLVPYTSFCTTLKIIYHLQLFRTAHKNCIFTIISARKKVFWNERKIIFK